MRETFLKCLDQGIGTYESYEKGEIIYLGLHETTGIYILVDGIISCYPSQFAPITHPISPTSPYKNSERLSSTYQPPKLMESVKILTPSNSLRNEVKEPIIVNVDELESERLFVLCHPGSIFGITPNKYGITWNYETTIADVNTTVYHISKQAILKMLEIDPKSASAIYSYDNIFTHRKQAYLAKRLKLASTPVY